MSCNEFIQACNIIRFSRAPFYVIYVSDEGIKLWNKFQELRLDLIISWDASGGLTRDKCLLYRLVVGFENKIIALLRALLTIHSTPILIQVLEVWFERGTIKPKKQALIWLLHYKMQFVLV